VASPHEVATVFVDTRTLILIAFVVVIGIVVGRLRGESAATIALNVGGYLLFLGGLSWAAEIGTDALLAAAVASLGSLMFTMAASWRGRRSTRTTTDAAAG
jgi:hypothetical protein